MVLQDAQTAEVQTYFSQWGPVNSCQLAHNDSALIALVSRQGPLQAGSLHTLTAPTTCSVQDAFHSKGYADPSPCHMYMICITRQ